MTKWSSPAGRTLMVGLPGTRLEPKVMDRLRRLQPGGVILFDRNLEDAGQTIDLLDELRAALPHPLLLALDQEGGRVSRLASWIGATPSAATLSSAGTEATRRFGAATAGGMRALGFNLDFAPVVDLSPVDAANGIGDRSFGVDPQRVATLAGAFLDGLQGAGVAGCLKHFPGLGPTSLDSHEHLPTADRAREELERLDLFPYRQLGARAASVMVGHAHYPALDVEPALPATLSTVVVTGWLRERLDYRGLVVTDDLEMGAVAALDSNGGVAVRALAAGCDLLLYCADLDRAERAAEAIARAGTDDPGFRRRVRQAERAVETLARQWPAPRGNGDEWSAACREIVASSATSAC